MFLRNLVTLFLYHPDDTGGGAPGGQPPTTTTTPPGEAVPPKGGGSATDDSEDLNVDALDPKTKAYIQKLRKEAAGGRTEHNKLKAQVEQLTAGLKKLVGGEDDTPPEKKMEMLEAQQASSQFENAILNTAIEHGIPKEGMKYFKFLMGSAFEELQEGEELSEEKILEVVKEAKGRGAAPAPSTSPSGTTPPPSGKGSVTLEQFARMSLTEKSDLYNKNAELYQALFNEAKEKRMLLK